MTAPTAHAEAPVVDVVIVGAGPAGLSAALVLGRACRTVTILDDGRPRNAAARAVHGFLTRDGLTPSELRRLGRAQLAAFPNVRVHDAHVAEAWCRPEGPFTVRTQDGDLFTGRKLVVATGVVDHVPEVAGFAELYGRGLYHCPFCDGWEVRGQGLAAYANGARGAGLALELTNWSTDVILCTDGPSELTADAAATLARHGIPVIEDRVTAFDGESDGLRSIAFATRPPLLRAAVFFSLGQRQASPLAESLGCQLNAKGTVDTARHESTNVPGVFVIGDASRNVQWVAIAAAEGAEAAFAIVQSFIRERQR